MEDHRVDYAVLWRWISAPRGRVSGGGNRTVVLESGQAAAQPRQPPVRRQHRPHGPPAALPTGENTPCGAAPS